MSKTRTIRFNGKVARDGQVIAVPKTTQKVLELADRESAAAAANELTDKQLGDLIDQAVLLDQDQKDLAKVVGEMKAVLKAHAEMNKWNKMVGTTEQGEAQIKPRTTTTIDCWGLAKLLNKLGKAKKLFDVVFKAQVAPAKKYLGVDVLDPIMEEKTDDYGTVTLKRL